MKLNSKQQDIINKLASGEWEIGRSNSMMDIHAWMQKGGLGHGGETININANTYYALLNRQLISETYGFPTIHAKLTDAGFKEAK